MKKTSIILSTLFLLGCSNGAASDKLDILENESNVAYVEELNLLAPKVCLDKQPEMDPINDPFLIHFEISEKLNSFVVGDPSKSIDSRDLFNHNDGDSSKTTAIEKSFCTGTNLDMKKEISQNELKNMITKEGIKVVITELNGDVISSYTMKEFVIGKPDGSVVTYAGGDAAVFDHFHGIVE